MARVSPDDKIINLLLFLGGVAIHFPKQPLNVIERETDFIPAAMHDVFADIVENHAHLRPQIFNMTVEGAPVRADARLTSIIENLRNHYDNGADYPGWNSIMSEDQIALVATLFLHLDNELAKYPSGTKNSRAALSQYRGAVEELKALWMDAIREIPVTNLKIQQIITEYSRAREQREVAARRRANEYAAGHEARKAERRDLRVAELAAAAAAAEEAAKPDPRGIGIVPEGGAGAAPSAMGAAGAPAASAASARETSHSGRGDPSVASSGASMGGPYGGRFYNSSKRRGGKHKSKTIRKHKSKRHTRRR